VLSLAGNSRVSRAAAPPRRRARLVDDDVVHHPAAERPGAVHPGPARGQPLQGFLVDILGDVRIGREQRRDAEQLSARFGRERFEVPRLPFIHVTSWSLASPLRRQRR
jgi:hypothetical protein